MASGCRRTGLSVTALYLIISQTMLAISPINPLTAVAMKKRSMGAMMPPPRPNARARRWFHLWGLERIANPQPIGDLATQSADDPNQAVARHVRLESIQPLSPKRTTRQQHRGTLTSAIPIPSKPMTSIFSHAELFPVRASGSQTISPLIFSDLEKVQLLVSSQCALAGTSNRRSTLAAPATGLPPAAQPAGGLLSKKKRHHP